MKSTGFAIILFCALAAAVLSLFGDNSYARMQGLRHSLGAQHDKNEELREQVGSLRREVRSLQHDDRAIEKAARNELGLARSDEMIFIFDKDNNAERAGGRRE